MPTDETLDAELDQVQPESDHEDGIVDVTSEIAQLRKGNKTLSEQLKRQKEELDSIKQRFEPAKTEEPQEDDLDTKIAKKAEEVVGRKAWYLDNKGRIDNLSEESKAIFEEESKTLPLEKALRLAEYNEPYKVETKEQLHPKSASVNREPKSLLSEQEKEEAKRLGISEKAVEIQKRLKAQRNRI